MSQTKHPESPRPHRWPTRQRRYPSASAAPTDWPPRGTESPCRHTVCRPVDATTAPWSPGANHRPHGGVTGRISQLPQNLAHRGLSELVNNIHDLPLATGQIFDKFLLPHDQALKCGNPLTRGNVLPCSASRKIAHQKSNECRHSQPTRAARQRQTRTAAPLGPEPSLQPQGRPTTIESAECSPDTRHSRAHALLQEQLHVTNPARLTHSGLKITTFVFFPLK